MSDQVVQCPHCKTEFPLSDAISHSIEERLRSKYELDARKKDAEFRKKEEFLAGKEAALETARLEMDAKLAARVKAEREKIEKEALKKIQESMAVEMGDLRAQIDEKAKKLKESQTLELELRKKQRELEESREELKIESARTLDAERARIRSEAAAKKDEEYKLKFAESENRIKELRDQLEIARRKAEQGSQQTQGEVLELEVEGLLKAAFPSDQIEPVAKGVRGADVLQRVVNAAGQACGAILWETKRTKQWSDGWIAKLKEDKMNARADAAVLLTLALPKEIAQFGVIDEIVVTNVACLRGIATVLRQKLIEAAVAKSASIGKQGKMEVLYDYLCGMEFRQRVETIVDAFKTMQEDLEQEKRAIMKGWAKRQKQLERVIQSTVEMHGDMQAIIGAPLPRIESLEVKALSFDVEET